MLSVVRLLALLLVLLALPASAQSPRDTVISQLREQGYTQITVSRTLLGRLRFVAISESFRREIIINPVTGQILRDRLWTLGGADAGQIVLPEAPDTPFGTIQDRIENRQERREDRQEERQENREERQEERQENREERQEERQERRNSDG